MKYSFVYILASSKNGTLYTGVTSELKQRVWQHKNKITDGFSKEYNCDKLVYFETHNDIDYAIQREKNIKAWKREWRIELIEKENPGWRDLYEEI